MTSYEIEKGTPYLKTPTFEVVRYNEGADGEIVAVTFDRDEAAFIRRAFEKRDGSNAIMTLGVYKWRGMWVFDDPDVGLVKEPFVAGIPEIIDGMLADAKIKKPENGFVLQFSPTPFPESQREMTLLRPEGGGNWYRCDATSKRESREGWLCPALFKYFDQAPEKLFARVETSAERFKPLPSEEEEDQIPLFDFVGLLQRQRK